MADPDLPIMPFASARAWERWLAANHDTSSGLFIRIAKKGSGIDSVTLAEALDVALCYGWIDGVRKRLDDDYFLQRYTPRRARSRWSEINRTKAKELIAAKKMKPAGLREIERAKDDGRWADAYASPRNVKAHPELQRALDANPKAKEFFATLDSRNRYAVLYRVHDAKKPKTRQRRIEKFVAMLARHEKPYP